MRTIFRRLGAILLLVLTIGAVTAFMIGRQGNALDAESKSYVQDAVEKITADWSADELWARSNPVLKAGYYEQHFRQLFDVDRKSLGKTQHFLSTEGQATVTVTPWGRRIITARYLTNVDFERGTAEIDLLLEKAKEGWRILGFEVRPRVLLIPFADAGNRTNLDRSSN